MQATAKNRKGRIEKNKKVKSGPCIFPFKYKRVTHERCLETDKGSICATSVNPKTKTLLTYGYCEEYGASKAPSSKKSPRQSPKVSVKKRTVKKARLKVVKGTPKPRTVKKRKQKLKLAVKSKTSERKSAKKSPKRKRKAVPRKLKSSFARKLMKGKRTTIRKRPASTGQLRKKPSPRSTKRAKSYSPSRKLKANFSLHHHQTSKKLTKMSSSKQTKRKLKIVPSITSLKPSSSTKTMASKRLNEEFIGVLSELNDIMMRQGEPFRAKAYREAAEAIMNHDGDITDPNQLKGTKHIGKTILAKLNEYNDTGTLRVLERERNNPINELTKVYGIGPKKAKELVEQGITSVEQLKTRSDLLTTNMQKGVQYFDDIEARIPRSEIDEYKTVLTSVFNESTPPGSTFEIVGSYRRGASNSGDIDLIVTNDDNNKKAFNDFLDELIKRKIVLEVLTRGKTKSLTIGQIPGHRPRRLDFLYASPSEYAFAVLYFTGSKTFNTVQRQRALDLGYSLNEHGLYHMVSGKKGAKLEGNFPTEKSIFDFLGMEYREPKDRKDGRSVALLVQAPPPPQAEEVEAITVVQPASKPASEKESKPKVKKVVKKRKLTLKKKKQPESDLIENFRKEGISALKVLSEDQLSQMIRDANNAYYCNNEPILTDNAYDILREFTADKFPENAAVKEGHTACNLEVEKNKVKLPYEMWSMDKIKPDTGALAKWKTKYQNAQKTLSAKLDGVSGMYSTEGTPKLYTRGNGKIGQDVSHLIPYMQLPKTPGIVIRGEFIIPKAVFAEKYASKFSNPRNFVAGVVNQKKISAAKFRDVDFVAYEVIRPADMKPSKQMEFLTNEDVEVVRNATVEADALTNELLSELLVAWRDDYKYEIDGVICAEDKVFTRTTGNPDHAFAFKMVLGDQIAEAKVLDVIWTPSKDGYLKPRVQIDPVVLGGATIEYATGFNGKFIEDNKIGVGALIKLIRSGDVIPHIVAVIQPAEEAQMPNVPYIWNASHVDIMLENKGANSVVLEKNITGFFRGIGVEGLSTGGVKRIIAAGFDTVPKIIHMSIDDLLTVVGFKIKTATKIHDGIKAKIATASLPEIMQATNIFGRGFGTRRFQAILNEYPNILTSQESPEEIEAKVKQVSGMAKKTSAQFVKNLPEFKEWMTEAGIDSKMSYAPVTAEDTGHELFGKKYVMTGFRDKELMAALKEVGAKQSSGVSKSTFVVLVKDLDEDTGKAEEARKLGVPLMTPEQFKAKYNL